MGPDIVLVACGPSNRMGSQPRSLIEIDGEAILHRQIRLLRHRFRRSRIIVVAPPSIPKPSSCRLVRSYGAENVGGLVALGLRETSSEAVLIVCGNIVFDDQTVGLLPAERSSLVSSQEACGGIGINLDGEAALQLDFGLPLPWAQLAVLSGRERDGFGEIGLSPRGRKLFAFEILNQLIDRGSLFLCESGGHVVAADSHKDIFRARGLTASKVTIDYS